jgi:hypothetical protein
MSVAVAVLPNYTNGAEVSSKSENLIDVLNPATQEVLCR